jgi:aminoglycoside phosphotransferase family enzyme/predicted kinase
LTVNKKSPYIFKKLDALYFHMMEFFTLVSALQDPEIYPQHPGKVDFVQTHVSAIFLIGEYVYKVKKPVDFGFLDFTTLEKRKFYCQQEVVLNRRLCPEIYLGVVEIRLHQGRISLGEGPGEIVEYAVLMRQLPQDCMMDRWLSRGAITPALLHKIAAKIAHFHAQADTNPEIAFYGTIDAIRQNLEENFRQTEKYLGISIPAEFFREIQENAQRFMQNQLPLFNRRIAAGKVRDCHGDLHLQHICLTEEILIFDCIEFNQRFRYSDVAADIAFLLMDLDFHGYPLLSADLGSSYLRISQDWALFLLLDFYKSYRAYVRGKVISFRLDDPAISPAEKGSALEEARRYFQWAHHYARRMNQPALFITCGLMGTGKSTIARALSEALGWERLSSDVLRKELAHLSPREHRYENFHQGLYSPDFSRKTYQALLERARNILDMGISLIIDASFKKQMDRQEAWALAHQARADFLLIECQGPESELQRRLDRRPADQDEPSDGRWELFAAQKEDFEKVEEMSPDAHLILRTEGSVEDCLGAIFRHLLRKAGREGPGLLDVK